MSIAKKRPTAMALQVAAVAGLVYAQPARAPNGSWSLAQLRPGEEQVPVRESVEPPDSPATDEARGNAEAEKPAVQAPSDLEQPQAEAPAHTEQPSVEP